MSATVTTELAGDLAALAEAAAAELAQYDEVMATLETIESDVTEAVTAAAKTYIEELIGEVENGSY